MPCNDFQNWRTFLYPVLLVLGLILLIIAFGFFQMRDASLPKTHNHKIDISGIEKGSSDLAFRA